MAILIGLDGVNDDFSLLGTIAADIFEPGTSAGAITGDIVNGGDGRDLLVIDYSSDVSGTGITSVSGVNGSITSGSFKVTYFNIERFNIVGTNFADSLAGGNLSDILDGASGDDTIDGFKGNDTILGGDGNDILRGGDGNDTISGGNGKDVLNGGAGSDTLTGGLGNDIYIVDRSSDVIVENPGEGIDKVIAATNFSLASLAAIEHLTLVEGSGAVAATGNDSSNHIQGNSKNNVLTGGAGNDSLLGLAGNDRLYGGEGGDRLVGDVGDDLLEGGLGRDRLTGGAGADRFRFNAVNEGGDVITDFSATDDIIEISASGFGLSVPIGQLSADSFVLGSRATDASHFVVYDAVTGKLSVDMNGNLPGSSNVIAILDPGLGLSNANVKVIA